MYRVSGYGGMGARKEENEAGEVVIVMGPTCRLVRQALPSTVLKSSPTSCSSLLSPIPPSISQLIIPSYRHYKIRFFQPTFSVFFGC